MRRPRPPYGLAGASRRSVTRWRLRAAAGCRHILVLCHGDWRWCHQEVWIPMRFRRADVYAGRRNVIRLFRGNFRACTCAQAPLRSDDAPPGEPWRAGGRAYRRARAAASRDANRQYAISNESRSSRVVVRRHVAGQEPGAAYRAAIVPTRRHRTFQPGHLRSEAKMAGGKSRSRPRNPSRNSPCDPCVSCSARLRWRPGVHGVLIAAAGHTAT